MRAAVSCLLRDAFQPADIGFVRFYDTARTAHMSQFPGPHSLTDAMAEEPRGFVRDAQARDVAGATSSPFCEQQSR